jgi:hypothetical protein
VHWFNCVARFPQMNFDANVMLLIFILCVIGLLICLLLGNTNNE